MSCYTPKHFLSKWKLKHIKISTYFILTGRLETHSSSYDTNPPQKIHQSAVHKAQNIKKKKNYRGGSGLGWKTTAGSQYSILHFVKSQAQRWFCCV